MRVERDRDRLTVELDGDEVELLRYALQRATFEDTPTERQNAILDFALALLAELDDRP